MALLKDTTVSGSLRATDTIYSTTAQFQILRAPIASGGTTYGPGTRGNFLKSNGTSVYWTNLSSTDIPTGISITGNAANVTGTVALDHGGTGSTTATGARNNLGLGNAKIFYGICSTAAGTVAKVVECADFSSEELKSGAAILVTFTQTNSGAVGSLTMNVNNTGAKALKKQYNTSADNLTSAAELIAGNTYLFVYNSTYSSNAGSWVLMTANYNNTYDISQLYSAEGANRTMETAANGGLGYHKFCLQMMTKNQTWSAISAVSGSTASNQGTAVAKVASTADFLLNSPILFGTNDKYVAPGASSNLNGFTAYPANLRYNMGTTASDITLTLQKPVYLVGKVNSDKATFKLDATQWWTQDLPTSNDGKIYIFLGMACSVSNIYLYTHHPIYYHNGTTVKVYNPGIHLQDETLLTNDGNEYVTVTSSNPVHIQNAEARDAENVVIEIKPAQDLHGYTKPWVGGAGKNILSGLEQGGITGNTGTDSPSPTENRLRSEDPVAVTVGQIYTITMQTTAEKTLQFGVSFYPAIGEQRIANSGWQTSQYTVQAPANANVMALLVRFSDDSNIVPADVYNAQIELGSTATAYEPYSNICPITGWDGCEVKDEGKNLLQTPVNFPITIAGVTWSIRNDGAIIAQRTASSSSNSDLSYVPDFNSPKLMPERYIFSCFDSESEPSGSTYQANIKIDDTSHWGAGVYRFTASNSTIIEVILRVYPSFSGTAIFKPMLELGSVQSTYEPYKSRIFPISLPSTAGTVYGGTIDSGRGKLIVDRVKTTLSNKTFGTRQASTLPAGGFIPISNFSPAINPSIAPMSDMLLGTTYEDRGADGTISPNTSTSTLYLFTSHTTEEAQALYSNATIIYSLATPLEYDISVPPITLFNGINNLWLNCGTMSFNYHTNIYPVVLDKSGNLAVQVPSSNISISTQIPDIQYATTTPTTRSDGSSTLREGDIWFKPVS